MKRERRLAWAAALLAGLALPVQAGERAAHKLLKIGGTPVRWQQGAGAIVTYSFLRNGTIDGERNCRKMMPVDRVIESSSLSENTLRKAAKQAFARWSAVADIRFVEAHGPTADIVIGALSRNRGVAFADVSIEPPRSGFAALTRALICLNPNEIWNAVKDGNKETRDLTYVLTHEIGHAIGLDHPGRSGALMAFGYNEMADAMTEGDIRAARMLYGVAPMPGHPVASSARPADLP